MSSEQEPFRLHGMDPEPRFAAAHSPIQIQVCRTQACFLYNRCDNVQKRVLIEHTAIYGVRKSHRKNGVSIQCLPAVFESA